MSDFGPSVGSTYGSGSDGIWTQSPSLLFDISESDEGKTIILTASGDPFGTSYTPQAAIKIVKQKFTGVIVTMTLNNLVGYDAALLGVWTDRVFGSNYNGPTYYGVLEQLQRNDYPGPVVYTELTKNGNLASIVSSASTIQVSLAPYTLSPFPEDNDHVITIQLPRTNSPGASNCAYTATFYKKSKQVGPVHTGTFLTNGEAELWNWLTYNISSGKVVVGTF